MKKQVTAAVGMVGLTGILASCGTSATISFGFAPGSAYSTGLILKNITDYSTNYQLSSDVKDQNGQTIPAGSYVICDNTSTTMNVDLTWAGGLSKLYVQFKGLTTNQTKTVQYYSFTGVDTSGSGSAQYILGAGTAPLSVSAGKLGAQGIVVNPVVVDVKGYTYVRLQGVDSVGYNSNIIESATAVPVVDCQ